MGILLGLLDHYGDLGKMASSITIWRSMTPALFLIVFLPVLLFASGIALDWHTLKNNAVQVGMLAFPGVCINTVLVAVVYKYLFPYNWGWYEAFVYGSIISAADPVAVVCSSPNMD